MSKEIIAKLEARIAKLEKQLSLSELTPLFTLTAPGYIPAIIEGYREKISALFLKCSKVDTDLNRTYRVEVKGSCNQADSSANAECDLSFHATDGWSWADFSLKMMPACCKLLVSCYTSVNGRHYTRQGWGSLMQDIKEDIARHLGVSSIIATVVRGNTAEEACLKKHGWKQVSVIDGDRLAVWQKNITEKK